MNNADRVIPVSIEAERAVLGSILLNRDAIVAIADVLRADDCYVQQHADIYAAMLHCYQQRIPPDARTVSEELRRRGLLDAIGGVPALAALVDGVPTSYHIRYYADAVIRAAQLRRLMQFGDAAAGIARREDEATWEATAATIQAQLNAITFRAAGQPMEHVGAIAGRLFDQLTGDAPPGTPTGLLDYDELTGGLHGGDLIVLAARPGVGKSSLAMTIAESVAQAGQVAVYSLEMSREQLVQRLVAMLTGIDLQRIRQRRLRDRELAAYVAAIGELDQRGLLIDDTAGLTISQLATRALRTRAQYDDLRLVVVDYLQLLHADGRTDNRVQEVGQISRGLKRLARELDLPVLALSQLSRAVEGRTSHVPLLSDLRESGDIENDADQVAFIYREELYDKDSDKKGIAELHIAKHRNGPVGVVPLRFDAATTRFHNLVYHSHSTRGHL